VRATTSFRLFSAAVLAVGASLAAASPVSADVQIAMRDGRVSIAAKDATIGQILSEWAKIGRTTVVNIEKLPGERVTLELTDVNEAQALELLLRRLTGYVVTARNAAAPDASAFDRIIIVPASMMTAAQAPQPSPTRSAPVPMDLPVYPPHEPSADPAAPQQAEPPAAAPTVVAPMVVGGGAAAVVEETPAEVQMLDQPLPYEVVGAAAGAERAPAANGVRRQALETSDPRQFKMPPRLLRGGAAPPPATPQTSLPTQGNVGTARPGMIVQPPSARPTVPIKPITPAPGQPPRNQ